MRTGRKERGLAIVLATALALACAPSPPAQKRAALPRPQPRFENELAGAPAWIRRGCAAWWANSPNRGICGVGSASGSRNIALLTSTAEGRGRTAIARTLGATVRAMLKDYQATTTGGDEFGREASDEQHIIDVSKQLTNTSVVGATRRDLWISPSDIVYALMVLDLERFQETVASMQTLSHSLREHVSRRGENSFEGGAALADVSAVPPNLDRIMLVTQEELDAMPRDENVLWSITRRDVDGPIIQIDSPTDGSIYDGPFPIDVEFMAGPTGLAPDMSTLRLEYKVAWGIDITDRVREFIDGTGIHVAKSELPAGRHTIEIQIDDVGGNRTARIFTVVVR